MSTNHFSTEAPWWAQHQQQQHHHMMEPSMKSSSRKQNATTNSQLYHHQNAANTTATMFCTQNTAFSLNLNGHEDDEELDELQVTDEREKEEQEQEEEHIPKEALFEKPLTPSDVGKLNRLVIPKQHAEKYFPLSSSNNDSGEKGLLLSFEDESGKSWRFRYSYWNSSQSYVLTKGWSRFVKEKRLDAGDIVMFERHRFDGDRFFIGWRRRNTPANPVHDGGVAQPATVPGGGGGWNQMLYSGHPYPSQPHGPQLPYQPDCVHAGSVVQNQTAPSGHFKTLRLFGVNLECQPDQDQSEPSTPDGSSTSSHQGPTHHHQYQYDQNYSKSQPYVHHNHMEINFSRDVNQMGYHQR